MPADIRLEGNHASVAVPLPLGRLRSSLESASLHLFLEHAPALDENRSFLTVTVNYGIVRSLRLDRQNISSTEHVISIPGPLLREANEIVFWAEQHSTGEAWTAINNRSFLVVDHKPASIALDISELPFTFMEPDRDPARVAVFRPRVLNSNTLEATAIAIAQLANRIAPRHLTVEITESLRQPAVPIVAVGLARDLADLPVFEGKGPLGLLRGDKEIQVWLRAHPRLQSNDGVAALMRNPAQDERPILLIAANSGSGLINAARGAMQPHDRRSGSAAIIGETSTAHRPGKREWRAHLPSSESVTLADLGYTDLNLTSANGFSVSLSLNVTPDTQFMAQGHRLILKMRLNPDLYDPASDIELQLNGEKVGEYRLEKLSPRKSIELSVDLPARLLGLSNRLVIRWKGAATTIGTVGWVDRQTELYMPRYYRASLPSLALLRHHLYPFSLEPDLSSTIIVTPDKLDDSLMGAVLSLASALGRLSPSADLRFRVKRYGEITGRDLAESHLIFMHVSTLMGPVEKLFPDLRSAVSVKLKNYPSIRELPSSWSRDKYLLVLTAGNGLALRSAIDHIFTDAVLAELKGDTAYFEGNRNLYFTVQRSRPLREFSYSVWINAWLRSNAFALPLVLATFSGLLFIALRVSLRRF